MLTTVHYLPVSCFILLPTSFILCYIIAMLLGHYKFDNFPYISDFGTHVPESCIFSQLMNIASALIALTIAVRYKQVEQQCRDNLIPDANRVFALNKWSFFVGLVSTAGLSIVANFQELQLFTVHMIGASLAFGFGLIYCIAQTRLSYYMYPIVKTGLLLARCRLALTIVLAVTFFTGAIFGIISFKYFHGTDFTHWRREDGGYIYHVVSSLSEWISAMVIDLFILSFTQEFKFMSISSPKFYMVSNVQNLQEDDESDDANYGVVNVVVNTPDNHPSTSSSSRSSKRQQQSKIRSKRQTEEVQ